MRNDAYILAFDTANEVIAIGLGKLRPESRSIELVSQVKLAAHRASNTQLLPQIDSLMEEARISRDEIACICVGRGPGSFTGVRIAMACAKGIASALEVALVGVSTQDAIAEGIRLAGYTGKLLVISDAMRKEIYPALFDVSQDAITRLTADRVVKAEDFGNELKAGDASIAGDALAKYLELFKGKGDFLDEDVWTPSGRGLLAAAEAAWQRDEIDPLDANRHAPAYVLPIYTRLSDAEENERIRLAKPEERNLVTGVQGNASDEIKYAPLDHSHLESASKLEATSMGTDAWNLKMLEDELPRKDRTWWMALKGTEFVGYAGALISAGEVQLLKIAVVPELRRRGIARELLERVIYDGENLAASRMTLEVRESNESAQAMYEKCGFESEGVRPKYYSDGESAVIMSMPLGERRQNAIAASKVAANDAESMAAEGGMEAPLDSDSSGASANSASMEDHRPIILAIETSCDETAASVVGKNDALLSDVVSSQIDFHARFGGVVPEIASRKHVEAIVDVCDLALARAVPEGMPALRYKDLDAIAVTYAPGLVGALVVGVAFAKGAAWGADVPFIGVNHLEGHLYANKLAPSCAKQPFEPPAIVSLVSGGNTMLVHMKGWQDYEILGSTIDDAVGEAFDKVAKALGLSYPGGPHISRLAKEGDPSAIDFPRAMMHSGDYRFSLSGLKTAVITYINDRIAKGEELDIEDICASFQQAVIDVQVAKAKRALEETGAATFCLGGGVAANPALREAYERMCEEEGARLLMPPLSACGDNAAMIGLVAQDRYAQGRFFDLSADAYAHADLSEQY